MATSIALASSRDTFPAGKCPSVVVASGARWDDALAASGLAGTLRSPVLLTGRYSMPSGLVAELKRLGAKRIYLVGNSTSVSNGVLTSLKNSGFAVTRISGANRYEVAKNVAYRIEAIRGNNKVTQAFVVRGDAHYDALSVSALAYSRKLPVLYTPRKTLSSNTSRALRALDIDEVIIGGDTTGRLLGRGALDAADAKRGSRHALGRPRGGRDFGRGHQRRCEARLDQLLDGGHRELGLVPGCLQRVLGHRLPAWAAAAAHAHQRTESDQVAVAVPQDADQVGVGVRAHRRR